jgi:hypothetical protein
MNPQRSLAPLLGIGAALASLFVIASVLMGRGNNLATLFRYLLVVGFACGLLFPRGTLLVWLVLCGYIDMLKRLMVVFGSVQHSDLFNVLGIPPMMVVGVTLSLVVGAMTRRYQVQPVHWRLLGISCLLVLMCVALAVKETGGSLGAIIPAIANDGVYAMLIFVLPLLFKDTGDLVKLIKILLWGYVPVALYGVFQQVNGFQDFEIAYLKTGLTLEIKQLYMNEVRAFSTMNSPTSFSVVCAMFCALSLMLSSTPRRDGTGTLLKKNIAAFLFVIYFAGIIASTSRSAILLVVIAFVGFLSFRSRSGTRWLYTSLGAGFVALLLLSGTILSNLDLVQDRISGVMGDGKLADQLSRVGTFSDRLHGFTNLVTNPDVYTLFGYGAGRGSDESDPLFSHDMISNMLVTHGVVPLLGIAIIGGMFLSRMHARLYRLQDPHHCRLAAGFLGLVFALVVLSALSGSVLATFPVSAMLWLWFAMLTLVYQSDRLLTSDAEPSPSAPEATPSAAQARVVHRFRRSGYSASESRFNS